MQARQGAASNKMSTTQERPEVRAQLILEVAKAASSHLELSEVLEALLFQEKVRPNIGLEYGAGVSYRPPLSDNIVLIGGIAGMKLGQGLKDIYERNHLFSVFMNARLQF